MAESAHNRCRAAARGGSRCVVGRLTGFTFTTFSSYMLDTLTLSYGGEPAVALVNVVGQTLLGLAAVWAGYDLDVGIQ